MYVTERNKTKSFLKETEMTWTNIILKIIGSSKLDTETSYRIIDGYLLVSLRIFDHLICVGLLLKGRLVEIFAQL